MPSHYNPDEFSQIHKTLSKSFVMQRKTLVRVLGLEGRVSELELQQAAEEQAKEGIDEILNDIHEAKEEEVGGTKTKTKTKPKAKAKPKAKRKPKPRVKKSRVKGKKINKPKIDADKFKRGTSQETVEERLERQARNRQETATAEEHKKSNQFTETTTGTDPKTGKPLSAAERKRRFKAAKFMPPGSSTTPEDIKSEEGNKKTDVIAFLNGDVKGNLDDVRDDLKQIEGLISDQNKSADDQYEEMRQGILTARKKKREEDLEEKKPGSGLKDKLLGAVTKPAGNFFNKIIKFLTMTFLGAAVNRLVSLLKDPAQLLDPIKKFFNAIIGMVNAVMKGLWSVTGAPLNFIIGGINDGVNFIFDSINQATSKIGLNLPAWEGIPLIPGPPEVKEIPLSKTAQAQNQEAVGMAGGGVVPGSQDLQGAMGLPGADGAPGIGMDGAPGIGMDGAPGIGMGGAPGIGMGGAPGIGMDGAPGIPGLGLDGMGGVDGMQGLPELGGGGGGTNAITAKSQRKKNIFSNFTPTKQDLSQELNGGGLVQNLNVRRRGFSGGGIVPAPYPVGDNILGLSPSFSGLPGYNKGGKVPGKGEGDTVPAMLTPGEFVMSKGAVDQIGTDKLMAMNKAGGGTNVPKMMKFAGGGIVGKGIDAPTKKGGKVVVVGGGGGGSSASGGGGSSGEDTPKFSSTDPNNVNIVVIKSLYNMMG